jgi:hypothetical protein
MYNPPKNEKANKSKTMRFPANERINSFIPMLATDKFIWLAAKDKSTIKTVIKRADSGTCFIDTSFFKRKYDKKEPAAIPKANSVIKNM